MIYLISTNITCIHIFLVVSNNIVTVCSSQSKLSSPHAIYLFDEFPLAFYMKNIKPTKLVKKQLQQMHIYQLDSTINKLLYVFYQISIHLFLHSVCPIF